MSEDEHERFISEVDEEMSRIRERKRREFMESRGKKEDPYNEPVHVNDSNFKDAVRAHRLVLVDFWADWCGPCHAIAPTVTELAREYAGKVFVGKLNVDENPQTAEHYQVFSIPTLIFMRDGKEVDRLVGCVPKGEIDGVLKKYLG